MLQLLLLLFFIFLLGLVLLGCFFRGGLLQGQLHGDGFSIPIDREIHRVPRLVVVLGGDEVIPRGHLCVVDLGADITLLQAGFLPAQAGGDHFHRRAGRDAVGLHILSHVAHGDAHERLAGDVAIGDQLRNHVRHVIHGDGEAQTLYRG